MSQQFLTDADCQAVVSAIEKAELQCSGEIRVHIDHHCGKNVLDRAAQVFAQLKMHKTRDRNGVLFYIAGDDRKFAVIGDKGINARVPAGFWNDVCHIVEELFRQGLFAAGLCKGIEICGQKLSEFFPYRTDDINELPDEISFGK